MKKHKSKKLTLSRETLLELNKSAFERVNGRDLALASTECCSYPCTTVYPDDF